MSTNEFFAGRPKHPNTGDQILLVRTPFIEHFLLFWAVEEGLQVILEQAYVTLKPTLPQLNTRNKASRKAPSSAPTSGFMTFLALNF
jgi:hypothetical protein